MQKGASDIVCTNTGKASKEEAELNQIVEGEGAEFGYRNPPSFP